MREIMTHGYISRILLLRLIISIIGLIIVIIGIFRALNPNQTNEEFIITIIMVILILIIGKVVDEKSGIFNISGIKINRFGLMNKDIIIGEDVIPVELKNVNPFGNSTFDINMELEFSENSSKPSIFIYKTKDKKITYEYSGVVNKDRCHIMVLIRQGEVLNFKLDKEGIIRSLRIIEIYDHSNTLKKKGILR